ncbi:nitroreductase/quinone reductase family protein [Gordonia sp. LSe1-13]|uniref:Nitroreductase/quinone reductase family protein n=1 Tax=Gordonia sesuvii TaxID=3116777 RepID=A0ABU7MIG3_9ACTN|nr:nitroreductase/quinone reductase family protein [Gordonia sp. LSe1-13]
MPLRRVDPNTPRSRVYRFWTDFGRSRAGRAFARHVATRIDPPLYRLSRGRYPPTWSVPTAPLQTTGARSGHRRETQVLYFHDGDDVILIASNFGGESHPAWYHNLLANPSCRLGDESFTAATVADPIDYRRLFAAAERVYAGFADYRATTASLGRTIPVLRLTPV